MTHSQPPDLSEFYSLTEQTQSSPEGKLLVAVIHRAIIDYTDPKSTDHIRDWAGNWLFSDSKKEMSVWWICQMIGTDPDGLYLYILGMVNDMEGKPKTVGFRSGAR